MRVSILALATTLAAAGAEAGSVKVVSDPPGADVYAGTLKLGTTTAAGLVLDLPDGDVVLLLEKPGFASVERTVRVGQAPAVMTVTLPPLNRAAPPPTPTTPAPVVGVLEDARVTGRSSASRWRRWSLNLAGALATGRGGYSDGVRFTAFAEEGRLDSAYTSENGAGLEGGLQFLFSRRVGVAVSVGATNPGSAAHFTAAFPHPLYFDRPRAAEGDLANLTRSETAVFLDLVAAGTAGRIGWRLFAGPAWQRVRAELVESVEYTHAYPFDTVTVTTPRRRSLSDSGVGFAVGAGADYELGSSLALGAQLRYNRAHAELAADGRTAVKVEVGGLQAGLAARIRF